MFDDLSRAFDRFREKLWVRPALVGVLSVGGALLAHTADGTGLGDVLPAIHIDALESLLTVMASSMLVIATFAVASMVSAYSSASNVATPRSFTLVLADDRSQNALSTFIGAFIFSIVALPAVKNGYFGRAGIFVLFALTAVIFALVVLTFVRWMDRIARLGRLGSTVDMVEAAARSALLRRRRHPTLKGVPARAVPAGARALYASKVGYVRHVDIGALQAFAKEHDLHIVLAALPGTFASPGRALAHVRSQPNAVPGEKCRSCDDNAEPNWEAAMRAFEIGTDRRFDDDPRFGLVVLSEIASRALSPAVNDPGTAIDVIGTLVRLFTQWAEALPEDERKPPEYDRVEVPALDAHDLFDDAFTGAARDGAGCIEVAVRLQKAFRSLACLGNAPLRMAALHHSQLALERANHALTLADDRAAVAAAAKGVHEIESLPVT